MSWNDAVAYVDWLNRNSTGGYRLPTEAEWEYAARGASSDTRFWGDDPSDACDYANVADLTEVGNWKWMHHHDCQDGFYFTSPVGRFAANGYGLHDMLGNVYEWTCSRYDEEYGGDELRCASQQDDGPRVLRGGSFFHHPAEVRAADRLWNDPWIRIDYLGFRLAQDN